MSRIHHSLMMNKNGAICRRYMSPSEEAANKGPKGSSE